MIGAACVLGTLALLRPWTIRPMQSSAPAAFDASGYVATAWPRILEEAQRTAVDIDAARPSGEAPSRRPIFVKVTGTVTVVDRRSRVGIVRLDTGGAAPASVALQVGPVVRGTAVRDALSFLRFSDFSNQTDFAAVSNAINDRVLREVVGPVEVDALRGRTISVVGAASFAPAGNDRPVELVPVILRIEGGVR